MNMNLNYSFNSWINNNNNAERKKKERKAEKYEDKINLVDLAARPADPGPTRQEPWVGRTSSNGRAAGSGQGRICLTLMDTDSPTGLVLAGFSQPGRQ